MFASRSISVPSEYRRYDGLAAVGLRACLPVATMAKRLPSFGKRYSVRTSGPFCTKAEVIDGRFSSVITCWQGIDAAQRAEKYASRLNAKAN